MRRITDILAGVKVLKRTGPEDLQVKSLCFDSRQVKTGDLFVAVKGTRSDGHDYIGQAVASGARAVICETLPGDCESHVSYMQVGDSAEALGMAASNFFGRPSGKIKVIGITGTNGKTTVTSLLFNLFQEAGYATGMISTVKNRVGKDEKEPTHTTPDALELHGLLAEMAKAGCSHCFMEVSSHAIHQKRIAGILFHGGIFTNITHEHLDYHATFKEYIRTKKTFFDRLPPGAFALVNRDDKNSTMMTRNCRADTATYGLKGAADFRGSILERHLDGMHLKLDGRDFWSRLPGSYNAYNLLAAYACAVLCGLDRQQALVLLSRQGPVRGRFETLKSQDGVTVVVDYAHTPDALKNVLTAICQVKNDKNRLITVVGAGGNRDAAKRPMMGKIASELSSMVILTSDNPRFEKPEGIILQMMEGVPVESRKQVLSIADRGEAIKTALTLASGGDIVLVAGKGHETYQEIAGRKFHFDDREIIEAYFEKPESTC